MYSVRDAMLEIAAILNRLSIAVQLAVVMCLFTYFLLLGRIVRLREVRLWMLAWLANAAALAAVFVHAFAELPLAGHRITLVLYLAGKASFAILVVAGARHHLQPGVRTLAGPGRVAAFVALWSAALGLAVPSLWHGQLAGSVLVAVLFLIGGITVLRNPRSRISRWLGWAMLLESAFFAYSAVLLVPALWGNRLGMAFLGYSSFVEAWVELVLGLSCIAVLSDRREEQLHYANRELLESQERLSRLVDVDPLTNLANRRSLRRAMDAVSATGGALIFIDINRFRDINDLFGHRVGDHTLQRLARLIGEQFRPEDHLIRWGGDQFLVVAPGMDPSSAGERVAAIRAALRHPAADLPSFSIAAGVAELAPGGDAAAALEDADRRMDAEKTRGR
jgi:diguanylate cyclase (GGDEF)-like protein